MRIVSIKYNIMKVKNIMLTILMCVVVTCCSSTPAYKQTTIPLNNVNGVPFFKDKIVDYCIEGFEVDEQGNFYFLAGEKTTLAVFSGAKLTYCNNYKEFKPNQIYILKNRLYILDDNSENNLYVLDTSNGSIVKEYNNIIKNQINSFEFIDTSIIVEVFDLKERIDMSTKLTFAEINLSGKLIKQVNNSFNLPDALYPKQFGDNSIQFLGKWNNAFLFWSWDINKDVYKFWLQDGNGKVIATVNIEDKMFGNSLYGKSGNPNEHRKLRNGSIFILGREGDNAIITELPLKELFK